MSPVTVNMLQHFKQETPSIKTCNRQMIYSSRATNSYFIHTSVQQVEEFIEGVEFSESTFYLFHNFNLLFI